MSTIFPQVKEWYEIDGIELSNNGFAIESVATSVPDRKGENASSPVIHGDLFREKRLTARRESWVVWISDADPTTGAVSSDDATRRTQFADNYDTFMRLLNKLPEQLSLVKQPSARVASCEVAGGFTIDDHAELGFSRFTVDVNFPDPRWYDASNTTNTQTMTASASKAFTITPANIGTAPVTYMTITFTCTSGTMTNPRLLNSTYANSLTQIGYTGSLTSGESVVISTSDLTVTKGGTNVISSLYRSGTRQDWMELFPAATNSLVFSTTGSATGTVSIVYKKAYF
jgi:hypothetical protein